MQLNIDNCPYHTPIILDLSLKKSPHLICQMFRCLDKLKFWIKFWFKIEWTCDPGRETGPHRNQNWAFGTGLETLNPKASHSGIQESLTLGTPIFTSSGDSLSLSLQLHSRNFSFHYCVYREIRIWSELAAQASGSFAMREGIEIRK